MSRPLTKDLHTLAERVADVAVREELHRLAYKIEREFSKLRYRLRGGVNHQISESIGLSSPAGVEPGRCAAREVCQVKS